MTIKNDQGIITVSSIAKFLGIIGACGGIVISLLSYAFSIKNDISLLSQKFTYQAQKDTEQDQHLQRIDSEVITQQDKLNLMNNKLDVSIAILKRLEDKSVK
jgi:hypothetical protein